MANDLTSIFDTKQDVGAIRMNEILRDPKIYQIAVNRFDRVYTSSTNGVQLVKDVFPNNESYILWLNQLLFITDVDYDDVETAPTSIIEGSFDAHQTDVRGSIHIATKELTRGEPALTVRKQPVEVITLDSMVQQRMMSQDMKQFLEMAVRGRSNILISGGSGAGKTTLTKALSWFVDPNHRILVAEEIDELNLDDILPNVVSLTTHRAFDAQGKIVREVKLEDLVKEALRMRADRIWVGETRGKEAYALVKACNSGHDGSVTTIHADSGKGAVKQLITYVMESGLSEEVSREQVAQAFHLVVQISRIKMGRRVITEITELEPVREGNEQRRNTLFVYDYESDSFRRVANPTARLVGDWNKNGANYSLISTNNM